MSTALSAVRELYANLPTTDCKGLCWNSCGPIDMSQAERSRLADLGVDIPVFTHESAERWANGEPLHCPALNSFGRCDVYDDRPLICRMWGVTESMPCTYGCAATPGLLPDLEAMQLIHESLARGGSDLPVSSGSAATLRALMADPDCGPLMKRFLAGDRAALPEVEAIAVRKGLLSWAQ